MDEYISRQKALEEMHKWCDPCGSGVEAILAVPAEDVVAVIRCKDCMHHRELTSSEKEYYDEGALICANSYFIEDTVVESDGFCMEGKKYANF